MTEGAEPVQGAWAETAVSRAAVGVRWACGGHAVGMRWACRRPFLVEEERVRYAGTLEGVRGGQGGQGGRRSEADGRRPEPGRPGQPRAPREPRGTRSGRMPVWGLGSGIRAFVTRQQFDTSSLKFATGAVAGLGSQKLCLRAANLRKASTASVRGADGPWRN
ncbi:hypothetical protein BS50DRAFT_327490 [Corynespora cassiicola Philippines]|uniref:Uncharacterized protein n=1 Tax=Corynespora cassiicola Philippines TaxID=1448308 RepID=A0A2T2NU55_CORCC|nr:hypothetical protein BS50DRAFT_327490 [Corynespora cassiicola Philippines]